MNDTGKCVLVVLLLLVEGAVWAGGDEWNGRPKPADMSWYQTSLIPMVDGSPIAPASVRNLADNRDKPSTQGILSTTSWLKGAFSTETEVATNQADFTGQDPSAHMMRLGATGSTRLVRYGMTYRTADQAFYQAAGQDQREAWGEWKNGAMALRSTFGRRTTPEGNAAGNPQEQTYSRIDVSWNRSAWPHLGLSYLHNAASNSMDAMSLFPQRAARERVEAAMGYNGTLWNAKLASGYGTETGLTQHAVDSLVQTETLTASFRSADLLTVTPTLGYRVEQQPWSGAQINSPSASISMSYKQSQRLNMTAMGNYSSMQSSDRLVDVDMIGGKGVLTWELEPMQEWKPQLSLEGGYNLQVNRLMPSAQAENLSGLLRLVLATM